MATFSSLLVVVIISSIVVAFVGISTIGETAFSGSQTASAMNSTLWSTYAAMGPTSFILLIGAAFLGLVVVVFATRKAQKGERFV